MRFSYTVATGFTSALWRSGSSVRPYLELRRKYSPFDVERPGDTPLSELPKIYHCWLHPSLNTAVN